MHGLLAQYLEHLVNSNSYYPLTDPLISHQAPSSDDPLRVILAELDGVPNFGNEELKDARDSVITLELTNRFANVRG